MEKNLRKCYRFMDLPFSATKEDIEMRKNAMIKTLKAKQNDKIDLEIIKVQNATNLILENLKNNGVPKEEDHYFEASNESIWGLVIVLFFVSLFCYFSFYFL